MSETTLVFSIAVCSGEANGLLQGGDELYLAPIATVGVYPNIMFLFDPLHVVLIRG